MQWSRKLLRSSRFCLDYSKVLKPNNLRFAPVNEETLPISLRQKVTEYVNKDLELPKSYQTYDYIPAGQVNTPIKDAASRLRGVLRVVQNFQNELRIFPMEAIVYRCEYFDLRFYPCDHILSIFRKSKPAVNMKVAAPLYMNGVLQKYPKLKVKDLSKLQDEFYKKFKFILKSYPSMYPKDRAVLRRKAKLLTNRAFIEEWCRLNGDKAVMEQITMSNDFNDKSKHNWKFIDAGGNPLPGVAKDGFYQYFSLKLAINSTENDFINHVKKSVQTVSKLNLDHFRKSLKEGDGESWVENSNSRYPIYRLNQQLKINNLPILQQLTAKETKDAECNE